MRISDWSSDVCSSDLVPALLRGNVEEFVPAQRRHAARVGDAVGLVVARIAHAADDAEAVAERDRRVAEQRDAVEPRSLIVNVGERDRRDELAVEVENGGPDRVLPVGVKAQDRTDKRRLWKGCISEGRSGWARG